MGIIRWLNKDGKSTKGATIVGFPLIPINIYVDCEKTPC